MSGKGSGRRPQFVDEQTAADAWDRVFGSRPGDGADTQGGAEGRERADGGLPAPDQLVNC